MIWALFFKVISFNFTYLLCHLFLMKIDFYIPRVIYGLFLNVSFYLEIILRGAYISKIELNLVRKFTKDWSTFPFSDLVEFSQSTEFFQYTDRSSRIKFSWSNLDRSFSKIFNFVDGGWKKMSGAIKKWGIWSDIVTVILPGILFVAITFQ